MYLYGLGVLPESLAYIKHFNDTKAYQLSFSKGKQNNLCSLYRVQTLIQHVSTFGGLDLSFWKEYKV